MKILFLSTWFPYPLSQGSKIRAYYLLRALAQRHDVTLISFADAEIASCAREHIEQFCRVEIVERDPFAAGRVRRWVGWFSFQPSSIWATYSPEMARRVQRKLSDWKPDAILALTYSTAQYAAQISVAPRIVDIDNLMSQMLREQYMAKVGLSRARDLLAWQKFRRYEHRLYNQFDLSLSVSEQDRLDSIGRLGIVSEKIRVVPNGVDTAYHSMRDCEPKTDTLIYTGALTYGANYQAIDWFLKDVFPLIQSRAPHSKLRVTGKTDGVRLDRLQLSDDVSFTGYLDDIRPAIRESSVCIVPLLSGGGTRLKILEAMALGTPIVSTCKGAEGLAVKNGEHLLIADAPNEFAEKTIRLLQDPALAQRLAVNARHLVEQEYDWSCIGARFNDLIEAVAGKKRYV